MIRPSETIMVQYYNINGHFRKNEVKKTKFCTEMYGLIQQMECIDSASQWHCQPPAASYFHGLHNQLAGKLKDISCIAQNAPNTARIEVRSAISSTELHSSSKEHFTTPSFTHLMWSNFVNLIY